jgi:hypothetical protein
MKFELPKPFYDGAASTDFVFAPITLVAGADHVDDETAVDHATDERLKAGDMVSAVGTLNRTWTGTFRRFAANGERAVVWIDDREHWFDAKNVVKIDIDD